MVNNPKLRIFSTDFEVIELFTTLLLALSIDCSLNYLFIIKSNCLPLLFLKIDWDILFSFSLLINSFNFVLYLFSSIDLVFFYLIFFILKPLFLSLYFLRWGLMLGFKKTKPWLFLLSLDIMYFLIFVWFYTSLLWKTFFCHSNYFYPQMVIFFMNYVIDKDLIDTSKLI